MNSLEVLQTQSDEEYDNYRISVTERLAGITNESQTIKKATFYPLIILLVVAILIVIVIIFAIFKKPKDFEKKVSKPVQMQTKRPL